jgi:hypothetical protein
MPNPNIEKAAEVCIGFAFEQFGERVTVPEAKALIQDMLFGRKALWAAVGSGLITSTELAAAVADRFHVWLMERIGRPLGEDGGGDGGALVSRLEAALLS